MQIINWSKGIWQLTRIVPVLSWTGAGILTTMLPILLFYNVEPESSIVRMAYLLLGGVFIQGLLAHAFNDLVDDQSGTDHLSNGLLSGGSRVLSAQLFSHRALKNFAFIILLTALLMVCLLFLSGSTLLAIVLLIGIWSAIAYSAPPLRLSYHPFFGEWLCAFPSITVLSLTPALLTFHHLPRWSLENACIHGLWCLSWLMFHHISDVDADKLATPIKNTTVVLFDRIKLFKFNRKLPTIIYFLLTIITTWEMLSTRPVGGIISIGLILIALVIVFSANIKIPAQRAKRNLVVK